MTKTLASLLEDNNIIITTGGLGPTSDDVPRFALAEVTKNELLFDEKSGSTFVHAYQNLMFLLLRTIDNKLYFPSML